MCTIAHIKPKTVQRKDTSIVLSWNDTFTCRPRQATKCIYLLEIFNEFHEWTQVYRGFLKTCTVSRLKASDFFNFRVKCLSGETEWCDFKAATDTEQFYVRHLTRAIKFNKIPLIRKIIGAKPIFLEVENHEVKTPLVQACEVGDLNMVNFLINLGANVNQKTISGDKTALMYSTYWGNLELVKFLIGKGAEVNAKDKNGRSPIHYAIDSGNVENVKFLLEECGDVDLEVADCCGWTPLLRSGAGEDLINLLIKKGANTNAKDKNNFNYKKLIQLAHQ